MNWNQGLKRVSLVWWGLWMVICIGIGVSLLLGVDRGREEPLFGFIPLLCAVVPYFLHRLTCWVIDGFSGPKNTRVEK